jgi:hypothetical protein
MAPLSDENVFFSPTHVSFFSFLNFYLLSCDAFIFFDECEDIKKATMLLLLASPNRKPFFQYGAAAENPHACLCHLICCFMQIMLITEGE